MIIDELRVIQEQHGYLPVDELRALSKESSTPLYQLHGVASFYPHFRLEPPPLIEVRLCTDMSCHLNGATELRRNIEALVSKLGPSGVEFRQVSCLGQCDRAPAAFINESLVTGLAVETLHSLIQETAAGEHLPHDTVEPASATLRSDPYDGERRYEALRKAVTNGDPAQVIATLKESDLRGLGGAGFPTGLKWEIVRNAPGDEKFIVCNADESEPGTIKDRFIMENLPHLVIEGMILAAFVTGAKKGIIYIRHEYEAQQAVLEQELEACRKEGVIGEQIFGSDFDFDLSIFVSPGGYICGEESALLEALEGRRAEPRNKPPFPGTHGLFNKPTVINNVETFICAPIILTKGVDWYKAQGQGEVSGLKFVAVSGHVERPGVYEIPMGAPARVAIYDHAGGIAGGRQLKAFAPSGPSSGYLPASLVDTPLDFKSMSQAGSMLGSGAIVVCAEGTCMLDMALNSIRFFSRESCGKCVPCRVGSKKMVDLLVGISQGRGRESDLKIIDDLSEAMNLTSICGLGQVVAQPIQSVLTHFRGEVEDHLFRKRCPSGVCPTGRGAAN